MRAPVVYSHSTPAMQFQIPQFIEAEDKIIGPFSLRQFLYVGGGVGSSMIFYFLVDFWLWLPIAVVLTSLGIGFGLVKINGRPLPATAFSALQYFWKPHKYLFRPDAPPLTSEERPPEARGGSSLERIVSGFALSSLWERVQTGTAASAEKSKRSLERLKEKYQTLQKITGEREVARRVDYR